MRTEKEELTSVLPALSCPPRHTMRHREPHILPTFANAASDMDNLDDVGQIFKKNFGKKRISTFLKCLFLVASVYWTHESGSVDKSRTSFKFTS